MNLIIPMAGKGTRLRPQTLVTPKPLIEIAGKTIIQRIVDLIINHSSNHIENIGFIIQDPNEDVEKMLHLIGVKTNIKTHIFYQPKPRGTAHAIFCAKKILTGETMIIFADTLFEADIILPKDVDGSVFVQEVENPSAYGVVKLNKQGEITDFIEKPNELISNLAIIGMYFFKDGQLLKNEIKNIIEENIMINGEYQITTVLENLKNKNYVFKPHKIRKWLDFGNPTNLLESHKEILKNQDHTNIKYKNTTIIPPCYIGKNVIIKNSTIGPNVSVGSGSTIQSSNISNTIVQSNSNIRSANFKQSIIGSYVEYDGNHSIVNIGDYSTFK
ncbi:MAG: nucleotidyltransferase [Flavobacteriales bacterium]|nr:nucleotidyltransferase [Flavobacteriales bacterium]|tara:strand:- start:26424 stop:27410 length:987 start_codon:yes stop_codon:yes gene_type:complete